MSQYAPLLNWQEIQDRLRTIFPEGTSSRKDYISPTAAKTVFVLLYVGAIEDHDTWLRPDQVTRMTDAQAALQSEADRVAWEKFSVRRVPKDKPIIGRWYEQNSREGIRDDCLRNAFVVSSAVIVRQGLATTSSAGRYALEKYFADLFNHDLTTFAQRVEKWQKAHLSQSAVLRQTLVRKASKKSSNGATVTFPNGEKRHLAPGPSSIIAKAVIEAFAPQFLETPAVLWLSESANKEDRRDRDLADAISLNIQSDKHLPDIILVDLEPEDPLIIFVEVVASDGPINEARKKALLKLVTDGGYNSGQAAFVTAYKDREASAFRKTFGTLAWQSFAWCMSEPDKIIGLHERHGAMRLSDLMSQLGQDNE